MMKNKVRRMLAAIVVSVLMISGTVFASAVEVLEQPEDFAVSAPAEEKLTAEEPAAEEPASEEPAAEEPATEEPATKDPADEEPAAEEPATETPAAEEPAAEEPATEEPATEAPATEEPAAEEPATEEPTTEEPSTEEPAAEEPAAEEPATEEVKEETEAAPAFTGTLSVIGSTTAETGSTVSLQAVVKDANMNYSIHWEEETEGRWEQVDDGKGEEYLLEVEKTSGCYVLRAVLTAEDGTTLTDTITVDVLEPVSGTQDEEAIAAEEPTQDVPAAKQPETEEPAQDVPAAEQPEAEEPAAEEAEEESEAVSAFTGTLSVVGSTTAETGSTVCLKAVVKDANMNYSIHWEEETEGSWERVDGGKGEEYWLEVEKTSGCYVLRAVLTVEDGTTLTDTITIEVLEPVSGTQDEEAPVAEEPAQDVAAAEQPEAEEPAAAEQETAEQTGSGLENLEDYETPLGIAEQNPEPEMKVSVFIDRNGDTLKLSSRTEGFDGYDIRYQWECDKHDGAGFQDVNGANESTYSIGATSETLEWEWRLSVYF